MSQTCAVESVIAFGFMKTNLITSKFREPHHVQLATELERTEIRSAVAMPLGSNGQKSQKSKKNYRVIDQLGRI